MHSYLDSLPKIGLHMVKPLKIPKKEDLAPQIVPLLLLSNCNFLHNRTLAVKVLIQTGIEPVFNNS